MNNNNNKIKTIMPNIVGDNKVNNGAVFSKKGHFGQGPQQSIPSSL